MRLTANEKISAEIIRLAPKSPATLLPEFGSVAAASQYHRLYDVFRKYVKRGAYVLDWGAGNGHFLYWLHRSGYKVSAFGFQGKRYIDWYKFPKLSYKTGSEKEPTKLPYPNSSFDAVSSVGVLEHVRDTKGSEVGSLKEINRILKPNGVFVCYHFVNRYSWIEFVVRIFPKKHHHIFRYTDKMIKDFLSKAGLELVEVRRYGILPRNNLGRVKGKLKYSLILSRAWNLVDDILGAIFNPFCQNYYFVARKDGKF